MNKKISLTLIIVIAAMTMSINAWANGPGNNNEMCSDCEAVFETADPEDLSDAEIEGLLLMREEEKLARDVYLYLADIWNHRVFSNIARSEQAHMDQVALLLEAYELDDPMVTDPEFGEFTNTVLAGLYNDLTTQGAISLEEAMAVGVAIEVLDIDDLENLIAGTNEEAILMVYENLLNGSEKHLSAFQRQLDRLS